MRKNLKTLWDWLIGSKQQSLPKFIKNNEILLRNVFSPINVNLKKNTLKTNTFRPPSNSNEISVNRLNFTTIDFCRNLGIKAQNPENKRSFFGVATIDADNVRNSGADIVASPIKNTNPYHGDIKIPHIMIKGQQPPSEIAEIIGNLTKAAKFYTDPNPECKTWEGSRIK